MAQGITPDELNALYDDPFGSELFSELEKDVLRFTDEVTKEVEPTFPTWGAVSSQLRHDQLVELTMLIGFWCMWNRFTEVFKVELEPDKLKAIDGIVPDF